LADARTDIVGGLAEAWRIARGTPVTSEAFAPLCDLLCDAGLAQGDETALGARRLGPFVVANTPYRGAVEDFLKTLVPSMMVGLAAGSPTGGAIGGALTGACRCFIELLRRGVVFRDTPADRLRWTVLMYVRAENSRGLYPTLEDVTMTLGQNAEVDQVAVKDAVEWLRAAHPLPERGSVVPLVVSKLDGGLECLA
jgi:transposase